MRFFGAVLVVLFTGWFAGRAEALQQMRVPFNFQWGESAPRVEQSLVGIKARIVERKTIQNRKVLVVEGIPQKNLLRALFYFSNDALNEIELQYGDKTWDSMRYAKFFDEVRRNVDSKYGVGRMVAREKAATRPPMSFKRSSATNGSRVSCRSGFFFSPARRPTRGSASSACITRRSEGIRVAVFTRRVRCG